LLNEKFRNIDLDQLKKDYAQKGVEKLKDIDFALLKLDKELMDNPFSLAFPPFLYYLSGKFEFFLENWNKSYETFNDASQILYDLQQKGITRGEYRDAGEFSHLRVKTEYNIQKFKEKNNFDYAYKDAKKIYESLVDLYYNEPEHLDGLISLEKMRLKALNRDVDSDPILRALYKTTSERYYRYAKGLMDLNFLNLKIIYFLEALRYSSLYIEDEIELKKLGNDVIDLLVGRIFKINEKSDIEYNYSHQVERIHLILGLAKAYKFLKDYRNSLHWLKNGEELIYELINGVIFKEEIEIIEDSDKIPMLIQSLINSSAKLAEFENKYIVDEIEFTSHQEFSKYIIIISRAEIISTLLDFISEIEDLPEEIITGRKKNQNQHLRMKYISHLENACNFLENKLLPIFEKKSSIYQIIQANIIFRFYKILKFLNKLD